MIVFWKLVTIASVFFICFCFVGIMKMGEDDFMVWLGGKIIGALRWIRGRDA